MGDAPDVFRGSGQVVLSHPGPVVTMGNFDGVHRGHQALVAAATELAAGQHPVWAYTFDPSPRDVMVPGHGVPRIASLDHRVRHLGEAGAQAVVIEPFDKAYAQQPAEDFARHILSERLGVAGVVVGYDFRFGRGRAGDAALLRQVLGVPVVEVGPVSVDGAPISSTRVRALVQEGRVAEAAHLLGRPHEIEGTVVHGEARGRTIGFPTANLALETELLPPGGVYAVRVQLDGAWLPGVANLGVRPTVAGEGAEVRFEVHVLDRADNLYDQRLTVALVQRLRAERRFDGLEALKAQIAADVVQARELL